MGFSAERVYFTELQKNIAINASKAAREMTILIENVSSVDISIFVERCIP